MENSKPSSGSEILVETLVFFIVQAFTALEIWVLYTCVIQPLLHLHPLNYFVVFVIINIFDILAYRWSKPNDYR